MLKKLTALLLALVMLLCACGTDKKTQKAENTKEEKKDIIVGIVLPMSDHEMIYGIQLAINEINLAGGINGRQMLATFLNYRGGEIYELESMNLLNESLFINLTNQPVRNLLIQFESPVLSFGGAFPGETSLTFSEFDSNGFEKLFLSKYSTKPNYTTAKAYEMIYAAKQLIEISNSDSHEDMRTAAEAYDGYKGIFHSSITTNFYPF